MSTLSVGLQQWQKSVSLPWVMASWILTGMAITGAVQKFFPTIDPKTRRVCTVISATVVAVLMSARPGVLGVLSGTALVGMIIYDAIFRSRDPGRLVKFKDETIEHGVTVKRGDIILDHVTALQSIESTDGFVRATNSSLKTINARNAVELNETSATEVHVSEGSCTWTNKTFKTAEKIQARDNNKIVLTRVGCSGVTASSEGRVEVENCQLGTIEACEDLALINSTCKLAKLFVLPGRKVVNVSLKDGSLIEGDLYINGRLLSSRELIQVNITGKGVIKGGVVLQGIDIPGISTTAGIIITKDIRSDESS